MNSSVACCQYTHSVHALSKSVTFPAVHIGVQTLSVFHFYTGSVFYTVNGKCMSWLIFIRSSLSRVIDVDWVC